MLCVRPGIVPRDFFHGGQIYNRKYISYLYFSNNLCVKQSFTELEIFNNILFIVEEFKLKKFLP